MTEKDISKKDTSYGPGRNAKDSLKYRKTEDLQRKIQDLSHETEDEAVVAAPEKIKLETSSTPERFLLRGEMPVLKHMTKQELQVEVQLWRNLWNWCPSEVKYYLARTGSTVGLTMRNYKRYLGILLETHWDLKEIELGVYDKAYDYTDGQYYFERKVIKVGANAILDVQWIAEREREDKVIAQGEQAPSPETQAINIPEGGDKNENKD